MPDGEDERLEHDGTSAARAEREAERPRDGRFLAWSVVLHVGLALLLLAVGLVPLFCRRDDPPLQQEEFVVAIPPPEEEPDEPEDRPDEPEELPPPVEPEPGPAVVPVTTTTTRPTTTTTTQPTTTTTTRPTTTTTTRRDRRAEATRVTRPRQTTTTRRVTTTTRRAAPPPLPGPRLSEEEVSNLLNKGATISDHTSIPSTEMQRCFAIINNAIRKAWTRPDAGSITGRNPEITISIGSDGSVQSVVLRKSSGNSAFDQSVLAAARSVRRFEGLSSEFISAKPTFTVEFNLQEAN